MFRLKGTLAVGFVQVVIHTAVGFLGKRRGSADALHMESSPMQTATPGERSSGTDWLPHPIAQPPFREEYISEI